MSNSLIDINSLKIEIGATELISSLDLSLNSNERIGITGPSGCGKTTLLKYLLKIHSGKEDSSKVSLKKGLSIAYMPQSEGLLPWFSLIKNLEVYSNNQDIIKNTLEELGLENNKYSFPTQMSGGESQRALLATAIVSKPDLFIADEPLTELDLANKWNILEYWSKEISKVNSTLLLVSHDIETLIYLCDKVIVLTDKPSTIKGTMNVVETHPRLKEFIVSNNYLDYKSELVELINGKL